MRVTVSRSVLDGAVRAPPSKSVTHRALVCSALAYGESTVLNPLESDDTRATVEALRALRVEVEESPGLLRVRGGPLEVALDVINCGESGTTMRFMTAVCTLAQGRCTLTGGRSLLRRPVGPLVKALNMLGASVTCRAGLPPVFVDGRGRLPGGSARMPGDVSSQFVSAILLSAPRAEEGVDLKLTTPLVSRPYVELTMHVQRLFGVRVEASGGFSRFLVEPQEYRPTTVRVEGDWSSASVMLSAGALAGRVIVEGLNPESPQPDRRVVEILREMGASVRVSGERVVVESGDLRAVDVDLSDCPDLFPVLAALCSYAEGVSVLRGVSRLRFKESDRVRAMERALRAMGVDVSVFGDTMRIRGGRPRGAVLDPMGDHRVAMALAVASLKADGVSTILDAECVSKSYPNFWRDLKNLGARLEFHVGG